MIKSVIIDDEKKSLNILSTLIERYTDNIEVCSEGQNVQKGAHIIREVKPDLLFLDISLPDGNGFDLLGLIADIDLEVIFTTAYSKYAIPAIKKQAVDYLLKPINIVELQIAVQKAQRKIADKKSLSNLSSFARNNEKKNIGFDAIAIPVNSGLEFVNYNDIVYLFAKGNYTHIFCKDNKKLTSSKTLKYYHNLLPAKIFFRTHNSYIINLYHIAQFRRSEGDYIVMNNGAEIVLSRRKKKEFLSIFI